MLQVMTPPATPQRSNPQTGMVLTMVVLMASLLIFIFMSLSTYSFGLLASAHKNFWGIEALALAEAGGDYAIYNLNQNPSYTGTNTCPLSGQGGNPAVVFNDDRGKGTYETCITNGSITNEKIIYATGKFYAKANSTKISSQRTIQLVAEGTSPIPYAAQTGPGGIFLNNSASIPSGSVYSNGNITMNNNALIGTSTTPVPVWAAHNSCPVPADATYPRLCSTGQPITLLNSAHIYGRVAANNQTTSAGMTNPGLVQSSGVATTTLPNYDRTNQKNAVTTSMTAAAASCSGGSVSWPANVHITGGNVTVNNSCVATINGNAWIDGNLTLSNQGTLKVNNSLSVQPTIMIDGSTGLSANNQAVIAANTSFVAIQFITFWSAGGCSPNCSDVTGTDLANSQNHLTINIANQGLGPGCIFYARWSKVSVSNSGGVGSLIGQTVSLDNNSGNISFGVGNGQTGIVWDIRYYRQL